MTSPQSSSSTALITGGAGFLGVNLADRLLADGRVVFVLDNMLQPAAARNLAWLRSRHHERLHVIEGDVRDPAAVERAVSEPNIGAIFHFAGQTSIPNSLVDPVADFEINARGTLNVLEAARRQPEPPPVLYPSTSRVYGALHDLPLAVERSDGGAGDRYVAAEHPYAERGVSEARPLDFMSPFGCSKGAAEQYVCDWARTYGLRTLVLRLSCIYGLRQLGHEDHGWVAHVLRQARLGQPITIYGDGRQVRDLLHIDDLVGALVAAEHALVQPSGEHLSGRAFNLGGGPGSTLSMLELVERAATMAGRRPEVRFAGWRTGDQRWYVSDTRAFERATGWRRVVSVDEGLTRLGAWIAELESTEPTAEVAA